MSLSKKTSRPIIMGQLLMFALAVTVGWLYYMWRTPTSLYDFDRSELPVFTLERLKDFNSSSEVRYLACNGLVFDVSSSNSYNQNGSYHKLAGRDASVALARMAISEETLNTPVSKGNLTDEQLGSMKSWMKFFIKKGYPVVGVLPEAN